MKKIICWIFGHRVDAKDIEIELAYFAKDAAPDIVLTCSRCGYKENILKGRTKYSRRFFKN
jgi:hypothetical protein